MTKGLRISFRLLLLIYLAGVCLLCLIHSESLPQISFTLWGIPQDKIVHFLMFLPFPFLAEFSFGTGNSSRRVLLRVALLFLVGAVLAGLTEYLQKISGYRSMELLDFVADCLGLALSCIIVLTIKLSCRR